MKIQDFSIGQDFMTAVGRWRCTDIGTRTITAIQWPDPSFAPAESASSAQWLAGPPYMLPEVVFDDHAMALAYRSHGEAVERALENRDHPGFDFDHFQKMMAARTRDETPFEKTYRAPLLRFDRIRGDEVLHPYAWSSVDATSAPPVGCDIQVFELFTCEFSSVSIEEWLRLPLSTPEDIARIAELFPARRLCNS